METIVGENKEEQEQEKLQCESSEEARWTYRQTSCYSWIVHSAGSLCPLLLPLKILREAAPENLEGGCTAMKSEDLAAGG